MIISIEKQILVLAVLVVAAQYSLALFCLYKLSFVRLPIKKYIAWNIFIMVVFFVGAGVFLAVYRIKYLPLVLAQKSAEKSAQNSAQNIAENSAEKSPKKPEKGS